jgi:putative copper resistance protein D
VAFVAGLAVIAVALQSGLAEFDDSIFWIHMLQHVLIMSLAPMLLVLGAPMTLALRALPTRGARRVVGVTRSRFVERVCGPGGACHLPLDYYGLMYLYLLTPAFELSEKNTGFHELVHVAFIACGLLFWLPLIGLDAVRWRPGYPTKLRLVGLGVPASLVLGLILITSTVSVAPSVSPGDARLGGWVVLVGGEVLTAVGLGVIVTQHRMATRRIAVRAAASTRRRARQPAVNLP